MLIELLLNVVLFIVQLLFSFVNLPGLPDNVRNTLSTYFDLIFDNLDFLSFFVHVSSMKLVAGIAISLILFKQLFKVIIWIVHKLPFSVD